MDTIEATTHDDPFDCALIRTHYLPSKDTVAGKSVLDISLSDQDAILRVWGAANVVRVAPVDAPAYLADHGSDFDVILWISAYQIGDAPDGMIKAIAQAKQATTTVIISRRNTIYDTGRGLSVTPSYGVQKSFYDIRSAAERHLGSAVWYLGAPNAGFSAIQVCDQDAASTHVATMVEAPNQPDDQLKPSTALFYVGVWSDVDLAISYQTSFAIAGHVRGPARSQTSRDVAQGRTRCIAFVIDQRGWAFDNIVQNMRPYLDGRYDITTYYISDYPDPVDLLAAVFLAQSYDNVHFMWRESLFTALWNGRVLTNLLQMSKLAPAALAARIAGPVLTTSVYDHLFLRPQDIAHRQEKFSSVDGYATSSQLLDGIYNATYDAKPDAVISDGVNVDMFASARVARAIHDPATAPVFYIGWVGNSVWGKGNASIAQDAKGLQSILVPAVERLVIEGYRVALSLADRNIRHRNRAEMVDYYGQIDVLVCASSTEGTPNPVLEAMASDVPFISTDVGVVREVAGPLQADYILPERSVEHMYDCIKKLIDDPTVRTALVAENQARIVDWNWGAKTTSWLQLFATAQDKHAIYGCRIRQAEVGARLVDTMGQMAVQETRQQKNLVDRVRAEAVVADQVAQKTQDTLRVKLSKTEADLKAATALHDRRLTPQRILGGIKRRVQRLWR